VALEMLRRFIGGGYWPEAPVLSKPKRAQSITTRFRATANDDDSHKETGLVVAVVLLAIIAVVAVGLAARGAVATRKQYSSVDESSMGAAPYRAAGTT